MPFDDHITFGLLSYEIASLDVYEMLPCDVLSSYNMF